MAYALIAPAPLVKVRSPFPLHPKQKAFVYAKGRHNLFCGGVGCGKTVALVQRALHLALTQPGSVGQLSMFTYPQIRAVLLPAIKQALVGFPVKSWNYAKSDHVMTFDNESEWWITHLDEEGKVRGSNLDYVCVDELTVGISREVRQQLNARLRVSEIGSFNCSTNSGAKTHWAYDEWYANPGPTHTLVTMQTKENTALPRAYIEDLERHSDQWKAQFMLGEWGMVEGLVYKDFSHARHVTDAAPPADCTWYFGVDFGFHNPFACLLIAIDYDGTTWIYDELYGTGITAGDWGKRAAAWHTDKPIRMAIADPGPDRRERQGFEDALRSFGRPVFVEKARKSISARIQLCTEKLRTGRVKIHPRCYNLLNEIQSLPWAKSAQGTMEKETPDPGFANHALDAWGYVENTLEWLKG